MTTTTINWLNSIQSLSLCKVLLHSCFPYRLQNSDGKIRDIQDSKSEVERKNAILRDDIIEREKRVSELEHTLKRDDEKIAELEEENQDLLMKLGQITDSERSAQQETSGLSAEINSLSDRIVKQQKQLDESNKEKYQLKKQLKDYQQR